MICRQYSSQDDTRGVTLNGRRNELSVEDADHDNAVRKHDFGLLISSVCKSLGVLGPINSWDVKYNDWSTYFWICLIDQCRGLISRSSRFKIFTRRLETLFPESDFDVSDFGTIKLTDENDYVKRLSESERDEKTFLICFGSESATRVRDRAWRMNFKSVCGPIEAR